MDLPWRRTTSADRGREDCFWYTTFGDCKSGAECSKTHSECFDQDFFVGRLRTTTSSGSEILVERQLNATVSSERFHDTRNYRADARLDDLVIFHASSRRDRQGLRYGRTFIVLGRKVPLKKDVQVERLHSGAFTIKQPETRCRNHAITIENCRKHDQCRKIGIHISAAALENSEKCINLPFYMKFPKAFWKTNLSFGPGMITPAFSVYVHSNNESTSGPVFTPVQVDQSYILVGNNYQNDLNILWTYFVGDTLKQCTDDDMQRYILDSPKTWKESYLLDKILTVFNAIVSRSISGSAAGSYFITKLPHILIEPTSRKKTITVFKDYYVDCAKAVAHKSADAEEKILRLSVAGTTTRSLPQTLRLHENIFPRKFQRDVKNACSLEGNIVESTAPLRRFDHLINQQILLRFMIGLDDPMYTRKDLFGILNIRFRTPTLAAPYILEIEENAIVLKYPRFMNLVGSLCEVDPIFLVQSASQIKVSEGKWEIFFDNISCSDEGYCNRALVHLDYKQFVLFEQKIKDIGNITNEMKEVLENLSQNSTEEESPYTKQTNGTKLTLRRGAELRLQISNNDAFENNDLGLRLLRIGRNRHLCFTHINHPQKAFMSDRKDVRDLIKSWHIKALKAKPQEKRFLDSVKLDDVQIEWDGEYFCGGSFEVNGDVLKDGVCIGDLLCIRQEILKEENVFYIWVSHGIICDISNSIVKFYVCTLSQTRNDVTEEGFCVEIIKIPKESLSAKEPRHESV